jgi:NADP-dependent 3-hydroxy acid dehydrogenase YdfG
MAHTIDLVPMLLSRQRSVLCHDLIRCDRLGPDTAYTRYDVTDEAQIATAVHLLVSHVRHLDVLYSNTSVTSSVKEASS